MATLETREFLKKFISRRKLLPIIFNDLWDEASNSWKIIEGQEELTTEDGIASLQDAIQVEQEKSGLITLSISWKDPEIAAQWTNDLVKQLNEQLREQAIADCKKRWGISSRNWPRPHYRICVQYFTAYSNPRSKMPCSPMLMWTLL